MKTYTRDENISILDGFLYGVMSFNGNLRDYQGSVYCIEVLGDTLTISELINKYYEGQHEFEFRAANGVELNIRELEDRIGLYLVREDSCLTEGKISAFRKYLSFRVADMIDNIFDGDFLNLKIFEISAEMDPSTGACDFVCIVRERFFLILQFNDFRILR